MNSKIIVCGTIGSIATRQYVDAKTNQTKELMQFSLPYRTEVTKDANGQDVRNTKWCYVSVIKNDYYSKFAKGDNITVIGEPNVDVFTKQDGTQGFNLKIGKAEITMNVAAARILPYEQSQAPVQNPSVPSANPNQGYPNPQGGYQAPQGNPYPQGGYQNPRGQAPVQNPSVPSVNPNQGYSNPQGGYQAPQGNPYPQGGYQNPMGGNNVGYTMPNVSDDDLPF